MSLTFHFIGASGSPKQSHDHTYAMFPEPVSTTTASETALIAPSTSDAPSASENDEIGELLNH